MTKKICSAGVVRLVSYIILDSDRGVIARIKDQNTEITTHHVDVDCASEWTERRLRALTNYETY
jgi:hypothetical protein